MGVSIPPFHAIGLIALFLKTLGVKKKEIQALQLAEEVDEKDKELTDERPGYFLDNTVRHMANDFCQSQMQPDEKPVIGRPRSLQYSEVIKPTGQK